MLTRNIADVEYDNAESQLAYDDMKRGSTLKPPDLEMNKMKECYVVIAKYLIKNLPIENSFLKNLDILHPLMRTQAGTSRGLKKIPVAVPRVILEVDVHSAVAEWDLYMHEEIPKNWYIKEVIEDKTTYHRIDHYFILRLLKYPKLGTVVYCLLSIAHGSANVERSLSYNKKTLGTARSTMPFETLSGIRMVNDFVKSVKTDLHDLTILRDMLPTCKLASSNY